MGIYLIFIGRKKHIELGYTGAWWKAIARHDEETKKSTSEKISSNFNTSKIILSRLVRQNFIFTRAAYEKIDMWNSLNY